VNEQARALILDIAGVPVIDTFAADSLIKTAAAVRLLGAETILTGVSPSAAKTMVNLGIDVSSMHTRNQLADGIELALALLARGRSVDPAQRPVVDTVPRRS
jgi:rsbT co-antagonist protein RsbR